jgi:hypothetical protein
VRQGTDSSSLTGERRRQQHGGQAAQEGLKSTHVLGRQLGDQGSEWCISHGHGGHRSGHQWRRERDSCGTQRLANVGGVRLGVVWPGKTLPLL